MEADFEQKMAALRAEYEDKLRELAAQKDNERE